LLNSTAHTLKGTKCHFKLLKSTNIYCIFLPATELFGRSSRNATLALIGDFRAKQICFVCDIFMSHLSAIWIIIVAVFKSYAACIVLSVRKLLTAVISCFGKPVFFHFSRKLFLLSFRRPFCCL